MFVDEMEWKPLTADERILLAQNLSAAKAAEAEATDDKRWWAYRAKLIELLLDNEGEQGEEINFGDLVSMVSGSLMSSDFEYGIAGMIKGDDRRKAFDGLPGVLAEGMLAFSDNVRTKGHLDPFSGKPSKVKRSLIPKKTTYTSSDDDD